MLGAALRALPAFRGKGRLGLNIGRKIYGHYERGGTSLKTTTMRDGSILRLDLRSSFEERAFWTGEYDADVIRGLLTLLRPGDTVVDAGANIGFYAIPFGRRLRALNGRLYAFEPIPNNFERLQDAIRLNTVEHVTVAIEAALGEVSGTVAFHTQNEYGSETGNAIMIGAARPVRAADVVTAVTTLDEFAAERKITECRLIKIDIEGAELLALRGAERFITAARPYVYYELNVYWAREFGYEQSSLLDFAAAHDYATYQLVDGQFVPDSSPRAEVSNFLMVPPGERVPNIE